MAHRYEEVIVIVLLVTLLILILTIIVIIVVVRHQKRHEKHVQEKRELQSNFQQELLRAQLEIQEQTFKSIAQEIHDNIGQLLSLAKLNLNTIDISATGCYGEKILDTKELVSKAIQDLRDLSRTLNTDTISRTGLLKAIDLELSLLRKTGTVAAQLEVIGVPLNIESQKELILFRIIQEALHNIIKHAQASAVQITALCQPDSLQLVVQDDGCGFDSTQVSEGSGLQNMRARSAMIGADFTIESTPGSGTRLCITVPQAPA